MAKKRFTDNFASIFEDDYPIGDDPMAVKEEVVEVSVPVKTRKAKKKITSKNFTQNLDVFLGDDRRRSTSGKRRRTGLDYLIRSTVQNDEDTESVTITKPDTKRVTLVFNKEHLVTLKEQAKERKMYLKDVVQEMVAQYLERED